MPLSELDAAAQCNSAANVTFAGSAVNGWCYVDDTTEPPICNGDIVGNCADTEKRLVRFVGAGNPMPSTVEFITCSGT